MKRVNDALIKVRNRELRQYDINLEYKATLHAVRRLGGQATPGEIARLRCRRPHTISQVLKNMEKEGLVTRQQDKDRKNVVRISLTDQGEKITPQMIGSTTVSKVFASLTDAEKLKFQNYLAMLYGEAVNKFAVDFKGMLPAAYRDEASAMDRQRVVKRTGELLAEIAATVKASGSLDVDQLVAAALESKSFSADKLRQLGEHLENLRCVPSAAATSRRRLSSRKYEKGELESALWRKLRRTHDILIRISDKEMASHGFSAKLASVLLAIKALGNKATSSEIARWRLRNASTMSSFLKRLEKQGLVKKLDGPKKTLHHRMALTEKGEAYFNQAIAAESIVQIFSVFSPEETAEFGSYLETIRARAIKELVQLNPGPD